MVVCESFRGWLLVIFAFIAIVLLVDFSDLSEAGYKRCMGYKILSIESEALENNKDLLCRIRGVFYIANPVGIMLEWLDELNTTFADLKSGADSNFIPAFPTS